MALTARIPSNARVLRPAGPLPWAWLAAASAQHARGLHVALGIWLQAGSAKPGTCAGIHLGAIATAFRFHPSQAGRALAALEEAGLVSIERGKHNQPRVTIRSYRSVMGVTRRKRHVT
jgi:hypothetical protein